MTFSSSSQSTSERSINILIFFEKPPPSFVNFLLILLLEQDSSTLYLWDLLSKSLELGPLRLGGVYPSLVEPLLSSLKEKSTIHLCCSIGFVGIKWRKALSLHVVPSDLSLFPTKVQSILLAVDLELFLE